MPIIWHILAYGKWHGFFQQEVDWGEKRHFSVVIHVSLLTVYVCVCMFQNLPHVLMGFSF